ncbi:MAG: hypothetical protein LBK95_09730 [Bifidobacteriaceae bacterium]|nr:hypothetical protein [Bifidobacteriaceae bacterium]
MKTARPALLPILRSQTQAEILALVLLRPAEEFTLRQIGDHVSAPSAVVHREISLLVDSSLFVDRRVGRTRVVRANQASTLFRPLTELLSTTYGVTAELARAFAPVTGIDQAFVHGSWAARHSGATGPEPRDIDVLVVGRADRRALFTAAAEAEKRLLREVNVHQVSTQDWENNDEGFLATVKSRPLVQLDLAAESDGKRAA